MTQENIEEVAQAIDSMACRLRENADTLANLARRVLDTNDVSYSAHAMIIMQETMHKARCDLLVSRLINVIRSYEIK